MLKSAFRHSSLFFRHSKRELLNYYDLEFYRFKHCSKSTEMVRVLNVAEKNDAAKSIAGIMSRGTLRRRNGRSVYNKIYEFEYNLFNQRCQMVMTSVSGHLLNLEFSGSYKKWHMCNPVMLFDAPIVIECLPDYQAIKLTLEEEARKCQYLVIWTDGDREGENIGFEIIEVCQKVKSNLKVLRAKFSEITSHAITRACNNLIQPDKRMSDAVNVRRELDLRIGAAFTRFQTLRLKKVFPDILSNQLISYGSCQFPTLGFVVERYKQVLAFIPEAFWKIKVTHKKEDVLTEFTWKRGRLFDHFSCLAIYELCIENPLARVTDVKSRNKSKWRPQPLDTVEFEKLSSRKLHITAKEAMTTAEKLYTKGFISYPRTETTIFPKELNLVSLVEMQCPDPRWGDFAQRVLQWGPNPRQGTKTDNAHPPIHPTKYIDNLEGKEKSVYELIVRHFLACVSKDAEGRETTIEIDIYSEKFAVNGLMIIARNYLEVYPYEKWNAKIIGEYNINETFQPTSIEMNEGETTAPDLLTEADLIGLMEKHGIGTDATHAEHIETIKSRLYVGLTENSRFIPGELGMGLVEGYDLMGLQMSKPNLRAELEADLKRITEGTRDPQVVLREQILKYKDYFIEVVRQAIKLDTALSSYLNESPTAVVQEEIVPQVVKVMNCIKCQSGDIVLKTKRDNKGFFFACMSYPTCTAVMWLPDSVENVSVLDEECTHCRPRNIKKVKLKVKPGSLMPFYPDEIIGCLGGCDCDLMEALGIRHITASNNSSRNDSGYNSFNSTTNAQSSHQPQSSSGVPQSFSHPRNQSSSTFQPQSSLNQQNQRPQFPRSQSSSGVPQSFSHPRHLSASTSQSSFNQQNQRPQSSRPQLASTLPFQSQSSFNQRPQSSSSFFQSTSHQSNRNPVQPGSAHNIATNPPDEDIVCKCGTNAVVLTVRKEGANKGRQFYKCAQVSESRCDFFLWKDDEYSLPTNTFQSPAASNNNPRFSSPNQNENSESTTLCRCGLEAKQMVVRKEGDNKGRPFFNCPKGRDEGCNFFQWADEVTTPGGASLNGGASNFNGGLNRSAAGPSNNRRAAGADFGVPAGKRKCGICSQIGHNRKKCPQNR